MNKARHMYFPRYTFIMQLLIALMGCLSVLGLSTGTVQAAEEEPAYVRVIHASPFVGTADVYVDGQPLLSSFEFGEVTDYVPVPNGVHHIQISLVGKGMDAAVLSQDVTVTAGTVYTVAALGTAPDQLSLQGFIDDNQVVPDQAKLRIYHLAPDASAVDIAINDAQQLNDIAYPNTSDYLSLENGPYTITITNPQDQMAKEIGADLKANTVTSIFSVGLFNGDPRIQLIYKETPGTPSMPKTGYDPHPATSQAEQETSSSYLPWLASLGSMSIVLLSVVALAGLRERHKLSR